MRLQRSQELQDLHLRDDLRLRQLPEDKDDDEATFESILAFADMDGIFHEIREDVWAAPGGFERVIDHECNVVHVQLLQSRGTMLPKVYVVGYWSAAKLIVRYAR